MPSVESVLNRSRTLDNPPYTGYLTLTGFEIGLRIHGKKTGMNSYTETIPATDPLIATPDIPTATTDTGKLSDSLQKRLQTAPRAETLPEVFHPEIEQSISVFNYESDEYIVTPFGRKVYSFEISNAVTIQLMQSTRDSLPIEFSLERTRGKISETSNNYQFTESTDGFFESVFSSQLTIDNIELEEPRNMFEISELSPAEVVTVEPTAEKQTIPCQFNVAEDYLRVEAELNEEAVSWAFEIDEFGQLSSEVKDVFELNSLYLNVKKEETSFIQVRPAEYDDNGPQVSNDKKWFLERFK